MSKIIGLKDAFHKPDGQRIRYWLKDLGWQFRYAWQRAWRGYDSVDIFDLGFSIVNKMPVLLKEYKKYNVGLFHDSDTWKDLSEEETNAVIDDLIFYFENCDEDHVYMRLFGSDSLEDFDIDLELWRSRSKQAAEEYKRCWKEAMRLFARWANQLWY